MAAPLVYAGVWGFNAYRAYRLAQAARVAAQVATAGAGVVTVSNQIDQARERSQTQAVPRTDACSTCDPKCKDLGDKIKKLRDELQKRHDEMREDTNDLFLNHRTLSQAHPQLGSWDGHVMQFEQKQQALRTKLREAEDAGCPEPEDDSWSQATRPSPTQPAPK